MKRKADLHTHTFHSDGSLSPTEIVRKSKSAGLDTFGITDHDSVNGIEEAVYAGKELGVNVIPGVEISTDIDDIEVHLLGYFIDYQDEEFLKYLRFFREERYYRAVRIVKKLNRMGINLTIDEIEAEAGPSAIGRPHIATAMLKKNIVGNYYEAFNKYIGDNRPANEKKIHVSAQSALKLINDARGLSFIAHPGNLPESIILKLINWGVDGIEIVHPSLDNGKVKFLKGIVYQYCLLESGGSDYHGGSKGDDENFGKYFISEDKVDIMRRMLLKNYV